MPVDRLMAKPASVEAISLSARLATILALIAKMLNLSKELVLTKG